MDKEITLNILKNKFCENCYHAVPKPLPSKWFVCSVDMTYMGITKTTEEETCLRWKKK